MDNTRKIKRKTIIRKIEKGGIKIVEIGSKYLVFMHLGLNVLCYRVLFAIIPYRKQNVPRSLKKDDFLSELFDVMRCLN